MSTLNLIAPILVGVTKGIADFALLVPWFLWLSRRPDGPEMRLKKLMLPFLVLVIFGGILVVHLGRNVAMRGNSDLENLYSSSGSVYDDNNILLRFLPNSWRSVVVVAGSYGCQGYYGLSLSLEEDFVWCYGFGHSFELANYAEKFLGPDEILNRTYPGRAELHTGWEAKNSWHTAFPWLASDLSFYGVIPFMFFAGRCFALCWIDVLGGDNPLALGVFSYFLIMFYYFQANNQVFQTLPSLIGFWVIFVLWLKTRLAC